MITGLKLFTPYSSTQEDLKRVSELPRDQCPRRYCWWWRSLAFEWDLSPEEGCTFLKSKKPPGYKHPDVPCKRAVLSSAETVRWRRGLRFGHPHRAERCPRGLGVARSRETTVRLALIERLRLSWVAFLFRAPTRFAHTFRAGGPRRASSRLVVSAGDAGELFRGGCGDDG
jgi:hypothetical protein